jgi:hypothetical protein
MTPVKGTLELIGFVVAIGALFLFVRRNATRQRTNLDDEERD